MLLNLDIIYLICEELDPAKVDRSNGDGGLSDARTARTTLLSLGLTNKAFLESALDVLWREIHSMDLVLYFIMMTKCSGSRNKVVNRIKNLLKPAKSRRGRGKNRKVLVEGPIDSSRWERMLYYTSRVQFFDQQRENYIDDSVYSRFGEAQRCIFPHLRKLYPTQRLISSASLPFFVSESLRSFTFPSSYVAHSGISRFEDFGPFLSDVAQKIPNLEELVLPYEEERRFTSFSSTLNAFQELRILEIHCALHDYEDDLLSVISRLPKLSDLSLFIPSMRQLDYDGTLGGFSALKSLKLRASVREAYAFLVKAISNAELQSFTLNTWMIPNFALFLPHFILVATQISTFTLLTRCSITSIVSSNIIHASDIDLWSLFGSFLQLHQMQVFEYTFPLYLSDERMKMIALAWPNLTRLSIKPAGTNIARNLPGENWNTGPRESTTINSLSYFAQNCHLLEYLALPIICQSPFPDDLPTRTPFAHPLHTFMCTLPGGPDDLIGLAFRLDWVFPSLVCATGFEGVCDWEEITRMIREELQVARR